MRWPVRGDALPFAVALVVGLLVGAGVVHVVGDGAAERPETTRPAVSGIAPSRQPPPTTLPPADAGRGNGDDPGAGGGGEQAHDAVPDLPDGLPAGEEVTCPPSTVTVHDAEGLERALAGARAGDSIRLEDGVYIGTFSVTASGTASEPIFLCGGSGAVLDGDGIKGGYVLHLDGASFWRLVGFTVRNGQKGVMADGAHGCVIQELTVEHIGDEAIHLRRASTHNVVLGNTIRETGLRRDKFGEGVYVGSAQSNWAEISGGEPDRSDHNLVKGNRISGTSAESVDVKEGTTGGAVVGNVFDGAGMTGGDSWVDVKGNEWLIAGNTGRNSPEDGFQTHQVVAGWGSRNIFSGNVIESDVPGLHFYVHDPDETENTVACDNRAAGGRIRSTVPCGER